MKRILFLLSFIAVLSTNLIIGQNCTPDFETKSEIQDLADWTANKLMNCCSSFGGKSISATVYYDLDDQGRCMTRVSKLTNSLIITMKVQWYGNWSGTRYWIKGKLNVDMNSGKKEWLKTADSGGFSPGCSRGCIN